uniref:DOMON domain-containing protein n=1 Tax=Mesocestoides corti TaxID=53468 RepID=A0A5K3EJ16_MESCO
KLQSHSSLKTSAVAPHSGADILDHARPQPILCLFMFQWQVRKTSSQPETDTNGKQFVMSGTASVEDSDGRILTFGSGL